MLAILSSVTEVRSQGSDAISKAETGDYRDSQLRGIGYPQTSAEGQKIVNMTDRVPEVQH